MEIWFEAKNLEFGSYLMEQRKFIRSIIGAEELDSIDNQLFDLKWKEIPALKEKLQNNKKWLWLDPVLFVALVVIIIKLSEVLGSDAQFLIDFSNEIVAVIFLVCLLLYPFFCIRILLAKKKLKKAESQLLKYNDELQRRKKAVESNKENISALLPEKYIYEFVSKMKEFETKGRQIYSKGGQYPSKSTLIEASNCGHPIAIVKSVIEMSSNELRETKSYGIPYFLQWDPQLKTERNSKINSDRFHLERLLNLCDYKSVDDVLCRLMNDIYKEELAAVALPVEYLRTLLAYSNYDDPGRKNESKIKEMIKTQGYTIGKFDSALYQSIQGIEPFFGATYDEIKEAVDAVNEQKRKNETPKEEVEYVYVPDVTGM